jgi:hypothetical protein
MAMHTQKANEITPTWDNGLTWANIPTDLDSPTKTEEKLWQTVRRLGNDLYGEMLQPGVIVPAGGTIEEAKEIQRFAVSYGLNIGQFFDTAITQALHDRSKTESPESFMLDAVFGGTARNPDDVNPDYGKPGEEQDPTGSPKEAGISGDKVMKAIDEVVHKGSPEKTAKRSHIEVNGCGSAERVDNATGKRTLLATEGGSADDEADDEYDV